MSNVSFAEHFISDKVKAIRGGFPQQTSVPTPGLLTLSSGTPDFPTPPHVIEAAKNALDAGHTTYTPWAGLPELRQAIAAKLARDNDVRADPEREILVTAGSQEAMLVTMQMLLNPGDEVLIHSPYYDEYSRDALVAGGKLVPVITYESDNFAIDPAVLERQITPRTKALIIVSPNNPTGAVQSRAVLEQVAAVAARHDLVVVSDELYEKFVYDGNRAFSIASLPGMEKRTITINSFSKCYSMTGWRAGYV